MDSNNSSNKPTFPLWVVVILVIFSFIFLGLVGGIVYFAYNPSIAAIPSNLLKIFVKQKVEVIGHSIYLHQLQDPDKDKDGLTDIAETQIFGTDPAKNDSMGTGVSDGQYVYSVYQKAFQTGDESALSLYRANFKKYQQTIGTSTTVNYFIGVPSLQALFNIRALETYNLYVGMSDDVKQIVSDALDARQKGNYQHSFDLLQSALQKSPNSSILEYHLALTYQDMKQYDKALAIYNSIENDPIVKSPLLYSDIASDYFGLGNGDKFVEYMRKSIAEFPEDLNQYSKLSAYYKSLNQLDTATEVLNEGLKIEPRYADYYNSLAIIAHLNGDVQTEFDLYQKAISYDFLYSAGHYNLALLYEEIKNDLKDALVEAKIALEFEPTPSHTALVMLIYDELGQPTQSLRYENELLSMSNIDASSYNSLGLKYMDANNYSKAEIYLRKAIATDPTMPNPYNNLGIVLASTNRIDEAESSYQKAIQLNPEYANAYSNLGIIYTDKKQYQTAIDTFKKAIQLNPNLWRPYQCIAYVYLVLGDNVNAKINYQKAVDLGDTDPAVISKLKELNH
jgi:tetratricopeptide (TPR) repeat protein